MSFLQTLTKSLFVFLFLLLSLLWSLTSVVAYTSSRWVPQSFFHFEREKDAHIEFSLAYANVLESAAFSVVAVVGYVGVINGGDIFASVGGYKKYQWLSLTPWLITFAQGWLINVGRMLENVTSTMEATNFRVFMILWMCELIVQALLWSEVLCVALQGWILMKNAHSEEYRNLVAKRNGFPLAHEMN